MVVFDTFVEVERGVGGWVGESATQDTTNALIAARLLALIFRYCVVLSFQPLILILQTGDGESVWDWVQQ